MYTEFYGLVEKPFALLPDPRFLYLGGPHRAVLASLLRGIEEGERFMVAVGAFGTGKTTLCRTLLDRVAADVDVALIQQPDPGAIELLGAIHREFGLPTPAREVGALLAELRERLLKGRTEGRRKLLVIDAAQQLSPECLALLAQLIDMEAEGEKLLQLALVGEPALEATLGASALRELQQRSPARQLRPLERVESDQYVQHRLRVAGHRSTRRLFSAAALRALHHAAQGTPHALNAIADLALVAASRKRRARIGARTVRRCAEERGAAPRRQRPRISLRRPALALAGSCIALAVGYGAWQLAPQLRMPRGLGEARWTPPLLRAHGPAAFSAIVDAPELPVLLPLLREPGARRSASRALAQVLELRGVAAQLPAEIDPDLMGDALRRAAGLRLSERRITWAPGEALELPLVLELRIGPAELRYAALKRVSPGGSARIAADGRVFLLPPGALPRIATGRAFAISGPGAPRAGAAPRTRDAQKPRP